MSHVGVSNPFRAGGEALVPARDLFRAALPSFQTPSERAVRRWRGPPPDAYAGVVVSNPFRAGGEALASLRSDSDADALAVFQTPSERAVRRWSQPAA